MPSLAHFPTSISFVNAHEALEVYGDIQRVEDIDRHLDASAIGIRSSIGAPSCCYSIGPGPSGCAPLFPIEHSIGLFSLSDRVPKCTPVLPDRIYNIPRTPGGSGLTSVQACYPIREPIELLFLLDRACLCLLHTLQVSLWWQTLNHTCTVIVGTFKGHCHTRTHPLLHNTRPLSDRAPDDPAPYCRWDVQYNRVPFSLYADPGSDISRVAARSKTVSLRPVVRSGNGMSCGCYPIEQQLPCCRLVNPDPGAESGC